MQLARLVDLLFATLPTLPILPLGACGAAFDEHAAAQSAEAAEEQDPMKPRYSKSLYDVTPLPRAQVAELAKKLSKEAFDVTQSADTERPFCGAFFDNHRDGTYVCVVCGLPLFKSDAKFDSGTGWPSFFQPFDPDHIAGQSDSSHGMSRDEIQCARCSSHQGHVFDDGPKAKGGLRYCINSVSLNFVGKEETLPAASQPVKAETTYFAGGCFWGVEHWFQQGPGVIDAESGYMQGKTKKPTYEEICDHGTGHAESVRVVFDPKRLSFDRLLQAFFDIHDPTQLDRQGPDVGDQYRSGIWTTSDAQKSAAEAYVKKLTAEKRFGGKSIVTRIEPAQTFWPAEEYHQDYVEKTGRACHGIDPWRKEAAAGH